MVLPAITAIARVVARATPAAFVALDGACAALESAAAIGVDAGSVENERAKGAIIAFRAACETRKALKRRRRK